MCINSILQIRWYAIIFISILISFGYVVFTVRVYTCTLVILLWFHLLLSGRWISFLYCSRHSVRIFCSLILESLIFYNKTHILYYLICLLFQSKSSFPPWIIVFFLFIRCSDVFTYWPHCRINIKLKIQICHQTLYFNSLRTAHAKPIEPFEHSKVDSHLLFMDAHIDRLGIVSIRCGGRITSIWHLFCFFLYSLAHL